MNSDPVAEFQQAINDAGIPYAGELIADGQRHRFKPEGDQRENGIYQLYVDDCPAGWFKDYKHDLYGTWTTKVGANGRQLSDTERQAWRERKAKIQAERKVAETEFRAEVSKRAQGKWEAAQPEAGGHRYLRNKGVRAHGLKTNGFLLYVPVRDTGGRIHGLQYLFPDGTKKFMTGTSVRGHYYAIGMPNGKILICEGYATGASLYEATGDAVAVAFDCGNLQAVAAALRGKYRDLELVIAADNDATSGPGIAKAKEAARSVGCKLAIPQFANPDSRGSDFNDLGREEGPKVVKQCVARAAYVEEQQAADRQAATVTRCAADVHPRPIDWLWPGRIAKGKVTLCAGDPGLGKSLITIGITSHVSLGAPWPVDAGECPQGDVVLLSAEDDLADTIRPRLDAAGADPTRVHVLEAIRDLDPETGEPIRRAFSLKRDLLALKALIVRLGDCQVVVIDPISAYLDGTDSHKNSDIRGLLMPLSDLAAGRNVAIVAVSHLSKSGTANAIYRTMGSLAFVAAARSVLGVVKDQDDEARRLVLPIKNNLAPDTTGLAYRIGQADNGAPRLEWEPTPVTISVDEVLKSDLDRETKTERQEAVEWLEDLLSGGPVSVNEIEKESKRDGLAWRTVRRAKDDLGIESVKRQFSGKWSWALPLEDGQKHEDVHPKSVDTFGKVGHLRKEAIEDGQVDTFVEDGDFEVF